MKLYKLCFCDYEFGNTINRIQWEGTQASAKKAQKELEEKYGRHNVDMVVTVEVPTSKPELLEWLNINASMEVPE